MAKKIGFVTFLRERYGITPQYFNNNYEGRQADEVYDSWYRYMSSDIYDYGEWIKSLAPLVEIDDSYACE